MPTRICAILLAAVFLSGCGATAKFVYPANPDKLIKLSDQPKYAKDIAVVPFEEMRGSKNSSGTYMLYLIPLMPFGYGEYQRPDAARMFNTIAQFQFDVTEDLAKAAATSLRKSGLFKDAYFTFGGEKSKANYVFVGAVRSTTYEGYLYTYGLSVFGPLLWFVAFPLGSSQNELILDFELRDSLTNEKLWQYSYHDRSSVTQGLYYAMGHDVKGYAELMEKAMNLAITDLDRKLGPKLAAP
jgi:hypothetical protein